ncbi:MAG: hypothetical protein JSR54_07675 [Proteobacteria bacterium]|nr:hypothetical protein [Pseudomonadota bacterium]
MNAATALRRTALVAAAMAFLLLAAGLGFYVARTLLAGYDRDETLLPALTLLEENRQIMASLQRAAGLESPQGLLPYYLERIRADGAPKHSALRQQIDRLVDNNTALVTLLSKYLPRARHASFQRAANQYAEYAASFRDRWQSLFELFMGGGNLPTQAPQPPADIEAAIRQELR